MVPTTPYSNPWTEPRVGVRRLALTHGSSPISPCRLQRSGSRSARGRPAEWRRRPLPLRPPSGARVDRRGRGAPLRYPARVRASAKPRRGATMVGGALMTTAWGTRSTAPTDPHGGALVAFLYFFPYGLVPVPAGGTCGRPGLHVWSVGAARGTNPCLVNLRRPKPGIRTRKTRSTSQARSRSSRGPVGLPAVAPGIASRSRL